MAVKLSYLAGAGWQFFTNDGVPLSGGLLYTYAAGTTTPQTTYTSSTGLVANTNPIVLNSAGRTPQQVWLTEGVSYKFELRDANNVLIQTNDNITSINDFGDFSNSSDPAKGDALIGFRQSNAGGNLAGSVGSTVHKKLQEIVNVRDFGAVGDNVTDDSAAFQAAATALAGAVSGTIEIPPGTFYIATPVALASNVIIRGAGVDITKLRCAARASSNPGSSLSQSVFTASSLSNITITDITFDGNISSYLNSTNLNAQGLLSFASSTNITVERCKFTKFFASTPTGYVYSDATYQLGAIFMYNCSYITVKDCEYIFPSYGNLTMILECDNIMLDGLKSTWNSSGGNINESPINVWGVTTQNVTIQNCYFKDTDGSAINLGGIGNFIVQNNRFDTCNSPIDISDENWVDKATHPDVYNVIVKNNIMIDPQGATPPVQVGDTRAGEAISTHEVVIANNQIQMTTAVTTAVVVSNCDFVTITGNTLNGGSIRPQYSDLVTINNNVVSGRNATGANKVGILYYCRNESASKFIYGYIKNNIISYWEDGAVEILGFANAQKNRISITNNDFVFSTTPTNGQYITVTPSGGNFNYIPNKLIVNGNTLNGIQYRPYEGTDTAIYAGTVSDTTSGVLFGPVTTQAGYFTRNMTTAAGSQAVTGVGFKPRAIIFYSNRANTSDMAMGFTSIINTAADNYTQGVVYDRNATSAGTYQNSTSYISVVDQGSGNTHLGRIASMDSDGFTITWSKTGSPTGTLEITYLAIQ